MKPGAVRAEKARLSRRLRSLNDHRKALQAAIDDFPGDLDPAAWEQAFESSDPGEINRCVVITGGYSALINGYVEMLKAAARLVGLTDGKRPRAEGAIELIKKDGGLDARQADLVEDLYLLEGRVQHASPDVTAAEVREAVLQLRQELPGIVITTLEWLKKYGIEFP